MLMRMFAIYDVAVKAYMQPFFMQSEAAAVRAFTDLVNDPTSGVGKHPSDYTLFELGVYDDTTGKVESSVPRSIGSGVKYLSVKE